MCKPAAERALKGVLIVGVDFLSGCVCVAQELEYGLLDSEPKVVIADQDRFERIKPLLGGALSTLRGRILLVVCASVFLDGF